MYSITLKSFEAFEHFRIKILENNFGNSFSSFYCQLVFRGARKSFKNAVEHKSVLGETTPTSRISTDAWAYRRISAFSLINLIATESLHHFVQAVPWVVVHIEPVIHCNAFVWLLDVVMPKAGEIKDVAAVNANFVDVGFLKFGMFLSVRRERIDGHPVYSYGFLAICFEENDQTSTNLFEIISYHRTMA